MIEDNLKNGSVNESQNETNQLEKLTMLEELTVCYPEQSFAPIPYNTFKVGGIYYKTFVRENETPEQAFERAWAFLEAQARKQFSKVAHDFNERHLELTNPFYKETTGNSKDN